MTEGKRNQKQTGFEVKTFPVPFALEEIKETITVNSNTSSKPSKEQIFNQAIKYHRQGNISAAANHYKYFINQGFTDPVVFSNYGAILKDLGKAREAEFSLRKAIELKPDFTNAHYNLGNLLNDLGKLEEAELSQRKAIELKPDFTEAYSSLANILIDLGKLKEAESSLRKAIKLKPIFAKAHSNLGRILFDLGRLKEAEISTRQAIELDPSLPMPHSNLGNILRDLGKLKEAEISTRKAIEIKPDFADAHSNLGNILKDLGKLKEAEISTRKAIELNPSYAMAYSNLGNILREIGKLKEAEISTRKAIELNSGLEVAYSNLGSILIDLGKFNEAEASLCKAIKIKPNYAVAHVNLGNIKLLFGDYELGLEHYEFRDRTKSIHAKPKIQEINQTKLQKNDKLLIVSEQGLGDTIQYMRYIPYLRDQGVNVTFCAQKKLHKLIKSSGIDLNPIVPEQVDMISEGKWMRLLSIAKYLNINPKEPIITKPYISASKELINKWRNILSKEEKPIIGINWQGNKNIENNYRGRSIPLEIFSTLIEQNNVKMLSLQKGFGSEQLEKCSFKDQFVECQPEIDSTWDFLENAAIIENCDLIITCDTSIAHLAGGMGKNVWLLLRDIPFWTWGLNEDNTFWYPSMRLFRQKERHNWNEVMGRVSSELVKEFSAQR